jgi:hypothetical protein
MEVCVMGSSTKIVRRLLDERGVEWTVPDESWNQDSITYWKVGSIKWVAFESENDTLWLNCNSVIDLIPAQAIAATLGAGTCWLHDCDGSFSSVSRPVWRCDCGAFMTQYTDATTYHKPRFCPNCGQKVVDA